MTPRIACLLAATLALSGCGNGGSSAPIAQPSAFVSSPDCPSPAQLVAVEAPAPLDRTFMRVQHIGDPGTAELAGEIANRVTWRVGDVTGFFPDDPQAQRGYRDAGPPTMASAFQLDCGAAGFLINTFQFSHSVALVGEGPSVSIARVPSSRPQVFTHAASVLTLAAEVDLRHVAYQAPHTNEGTAQLSFFYYIQDVTTGTVFAHVIAMFDSRPPGIGGSLVEELSDDTHVSFFHSPLLAVDGWGVPVRYVRLGPGSSPARSETAWMARLPFAAQVPYDVFSAMLARLRAGPLPHISPRPEDYRLTEFGVLGEVFPGTGGDHNVAIGASVFGLRASGG